MTLCTRGAVSAGEMGKEWGLPIYDWSHLDSWTAYDVVVCGTNHSHYVLSPEHIIPSSVENFPFDKARAPGLQQAKPVSKQPMCNHMGDADSCKDGDAGAVKSEVFNRTRYKQEALVTKLIFDLSVPRTVDPVLGKDPHLTLFNVEELGRFIDQKQYCDVRELNRVEEVVWKLVEKQVEIFHFKEKKALVCAY